MGIVQLNKLIRSYFKDIECELPTTKYNISFDGSLFLFSGCVSEALQSSNNSFSTSPNIRYDEEIIVQIALKNVSDFILKFPNYNNVYFFVDGLKPANKGYTSGQRTINIAFDPHSAMNMLLDEIRLKLPFVKICKFSIGESEHEFFLKRDRNIPNILLTNDTDLFHISFDYLKGSDSDIVYYIQKNTTSVISERRSDYHQPYFVREKSKHLTCFRLDKLNFVKYGLPKIIFTIISFLKGSDYTPSLISSTMAESLIAIFLRFNRSGIDNDVITIILNKILEKCRSFHNFEMAYMTRLNEENMLHNYSNDPNSLHIENINNKLDCGESFDEIYKKSEVEDILTLLILLLVKIKQDSVGSFVWCRNSAITGLNVDDVVFKKNNYMNLLTWSVNYSLLGSKFSKYHIQYEWVHKIPQTSTYSVLLHKFTTKQFKYMCSQPIDENKQLDFKMTISNISNKSILDELSNW